MAAPSSSLKNADHEMLVLQDGDQKGSIYDVLTAKKPELLRLHATTHGSAEAEFPAVYLDDVLLSDPVFLKSIPASWVKEVRYISASAATLRFGRNHEAGAILIITDKR